MKMRSPSPLRAAFAPGLRALAGPLLALAAVAGSLVPARAVVTFSFNFLDPAGQGFNDPARPEYKAALIDAGQTMGSFFAHTATVTINVTSVNSPGSSTLASAGSGLVSPQGNAGFFRTVVQAKVISNGATDLNGAAADGQVEVNLGAPFQYNPNAPIGPNQVDFKATMLHELTHAFGFISYIPRNPNNQPSLFSIFDSLLSDSSGAPLINRSTFAFETNRTSVLTGGNNTVQATPGVNGEFINGVLARAAFNNRPVPIFSPNPYQDGSSGSHLDDNTQSLKGSLMNAATETSAGMMGVQMVRAYNAVEEGVMRDIGYTLASSHARFFTNEIGLSNGVYYLSFPNGNFFGYYAYLTDPRFIFHFDLGYEYWFEANDGNSGVFFYDFKSSSFFYTSPVFPFPYLYDFSSERGALLLPGSEQPGPLQHERHPVLLQLRHRADHHEVSCVRVAARRAGANHRRASMGRAESAGMMMPASSPPLIQIEVWSDYVCPFCYLEEPVLARVKQDFGGAVEIRWRAFELRPEPVPTLEPGGNYLRSIWAQAVYPMAAERGMRLQLPPVQPRSRRALEAAEFAREQGRFDALHHALFVAFFEEGRDLGQIDVLAEIGRSVGLDEAALREALAAGRHTARVLEDEHLAHALGLSGVPAMLIHRAGEPIEASGTLALSGAQPFETVCAAIQEVCGPMEPGR